MEISKTINRRGDYEVIPLIDAGLSIQLSFALENLSNKEQVRTSVRRYIRTNIFERIEGFKGRYIITLEGKDNYRKSILEYKENRKYTPLKWKDYIVNELFAPQGIGHDQLEADDVVGIIHTYYEKEYKNGSNIRTCIVSADKDLRQLSGHILRPSRMSYGKQIADEFYYSEQHEADKFLFKQMIKGDNADNIKGIVGLGEVGSTAIVNSTPSPLLFPTIYQLYEEHNNNNFYDTFKLLYIHRDNYLFDEFGIKGELTLPPKINKIKWNQNSV